MKKCKTENILKYVIRYGLEIFIIYHIYLETGYWTTLFVVFLTISLEINQRTIKLMIETNRTNREKVEKAIFEAISEKTKTKVVDYLKRSMN